MNSTKTICESCGLPIEAGPYCQYCIDQEGNLQAFEERLERMSQWIRRTRSEDVSPADAEKQALDHMATMPAWRNHPALLLRRSRSEKQ